MHPSKQEIKFDDDNLIYTYIKSAVKHTLAHNLVSPALDFDKDQELNLQWNQPIRSNTNSNNSIREQYRIPGNFYKENSSRWRDLYDNLEVPTDIEKKQPFQTVVFQSEINDNQVDQPKPDDFQDLLQIHQRYIVCTVKSGIMIVDQHKAHMRILYEEFIAQAGKSEVSSQISMFPTKFSCNDADAELLDSRMISLKKIGFDLKKQSNGEFIVNAYPAFFSNDISIEDFLHDVINQLQVNTESEIDFNALLANIFAAKAAFPAGKKLSTEEMRHLIDRLFATSFPSHNAKGEKCFVIMNLQEIDKNFN